MSAFTDAVGQMSDSHLSCRDLGHRWSQTSYARKFVETLSENNLAVVERVVSCTICRGKRIEQVRISDGALIRRKYAYPDGYRFEPGTVGKGGLPKAPFRRVLVARMLAKADATS